MCCVFVRLHLSPCKSSQCLKQLQLSRGKCFRRRWMVSFLFPSLLQLCFSAFSLFSPSLSNVVKIIYPCLKEGNSNCNHSGRHGKRGEIPLEKKKKYFFQAPPATGKTFLTSDLTSFTSFLLSFSFLALDSFTSFDQYLFSYPCCVRQ